MPIVQSNPVSLFLPLLNNPNEEVRRQAYTILLASFGERALTMLRRLLDVPNMALRQQAREALFFIAHMPQQSVIHEPFADLYVECLGRLHFYAKNSEIKLDEWVRGNSGHAGWQKVQATLCFLVHCGQRGTTRAALANAVWGSAAPASVTRALNTLRQLFAELHSEDFADRVLTVTDQHCTLHTEFYRTDVHAFEQSYAMARVVDEQQGLAAAAALYTQTMQLYGGPYMASVTQREAWAQVRRDELRASFLFIADRVAEHLFNENRFRECVVLCSDLFDADESAEKIVVWLLRSYYQLERWADFEQVYRVYTQASRNHTHQNLVVEEYQRLGRVRVVGGYLE